MHVSHKQTPNIIPFATSFLGSVFILSIARTNVAVTVPVFWGGGKGASNCTYLGDVFGYI